MGDTPTSPGKDFALATQPFPGFSRSDVLARGRPSLVRYYAHTEQVPLNLNTYERLASVLRQQGFGVLTARKDRHLRRSEVLDEGFGEGRPPLINETIVSSDLVHVTIHRGGHRYLDVVDRLRHRLTDKVQLAYLLDACSRVD